MANKPARKKNFGNYIKGAIQVTISLGSLNGTTGVRTAVGDTIDDATRCSSIVNTYTLANETAIADSGPIAMYVAHSDYTLAEIKEFIELTTG